MLAVIQRAHYQQGRRISEVETLTELAQTLAIEPAAFIAELQRVEQEELANHIEASRELLNYVGGRGFPTFVLQRGDTLEVLDTGRWLGQPEEWASYLREETASSGSAVAVADSGLAQCDLQTGRCD